MSKAIEPIKCAYTKCSNMFIQMKGDHYCCSAVCRQRAYREKMKSIGISENDKRGKRTKELWNNPEYRQHMIEAHKGQKAWNTGIKIPTNTGRTRFKKGQIGVWKIKEMSQEHKQRLLAANHAKRGKPVYKTRGENNWHWKGGISKTEREKIKNTLEYKNWRRAVYERDNYTCQHCNQRGGKLHADHIKPFSLFPELRFELENGRTLCESCHKKTDTWGGKIHKLNGRKTA